MALSDYLAKNYLNASTPASSDPSDTRPTKKRKKNKQTTSEAVGSLLIADDDDDLLLSSRKSAVQGDDENDTPTLFDTQVRSAEFRKSKKNAWKSLSTSAPHGTPRQQDDDEADMILRQQQASTNQSRLDLEAENAPAIVTSTTSPKTSSGIRPGLQTAADTARLQAEERAALSHPKPSKSKSQKPSHENQEEETIYRDATGRRIDLSLRRTEALRQEKSRLAAEKAARDDAMGAVQLAAKQQSKTDLSNAKFLTLARTIDDEELNSSLKEKIHWDDPMASYISSTTKPVSSSTQHNKEGGGISIPRKKVYQGSAAPNRYNIKPGWRWDGVDRGNGFEKEWFQARGRKTRNENLEYQWQMDE